MTDLTPEQARNQLNRMESVIDACVMTDYNVEQLQPAYEIKLSAELAQFYRLHRNGSAYEIIDLEADPCEPFQIFDRRSEQENYSAAIAWMKAQQRID